MHGDVVLRGPVWLLATVLMLGAVGLALYVVADSVRRSSGRRRGGTVARAPWTYAAVQLIFLGALMVAQLLGGVSIVSAVPVALAPVAFAVGVAYLLKVVFPKGAVAADEPEQAFGVSITDVPPEE